MTPLFGHKEKEKPRDEGGGATENGEGEMAKAARGAMLAPVADAKANEGAVSSSAPTTTPGKGNDIVALAGSSAASKTEHDKPRGIVAPPYMRPFLKPSRSDPTLLSSYGDDSLMLMRPPYHHIQAMYTAGAQASKVCGRVF